MALFFDSPLFNIMWEMPGGWQTVGLTDLVSVDATGIMLHVRNKQPTTDRAFGIRMTGSSDTQTGTVQAASSQFFFIGLDENLCFDLYTLNGTTDFEVYII